MILTFDNTGKSDVQYIYLRCFNCCFLSAFPEEDECLFFGGYYRMKLVCLRLLATHQNFQQFVRCCMYLDSMITGADMIDFKLNKNDRFVIDNLLKYALNKQSLIEFDEYIIESFNAFRQNRQEISLSLFFLERIADTESHKLLFYSAKKNQQQRQSDDFSNLFRSELLSLFSGARVLTFKLAAYSFSIAALLQLITDSNLKEVVVSKGAKMWIDKAWQSEKAMLTNQYEQNGFDISFVDATCTLTITAK